MADGSTIPRTHHLAAPEHFGLAAGALGRLRRIHELPDVESERRLRRGEKTSRRQGDHYCSLSRVTCQALNSVRGEL